MNDVIVVSYNPIYFFFKGFLRLHCFGSDNRFIEYPIRPMPMMLNSRPANGISVTMDPSPRIPAKVKLHEAHPVTIRPAPVPIIPVTLDALNCRRCSMNSEKYTPNDNARIRFNIE